MGKSKKIGTETESAVVKVLQTRGWPSAERKALTGAIDLGDITGTPGLTWQVKGGHMAEGASDTEVNEWLEDAVDQAKAAGSDVGILVWKRKAVGAANAHRWWSAMRAVDLAELLTCGADAFELSYAACRMPLEDMIEILHLGGYGDG